MNAVLQVEKEKGVEVSFKPALEECFPTSEVAITTVQTSKLATVVINSYSKEESVLNGSIGSIRMEVSSVPKGFCQYLHDRKKAGVISYGKRTLYILPPKTRDDTILTCVCAGPTGAVGLLSSASLSQPRSTVSSSSSSSTGAQPTAAASKPASQAPVAKKGDDFLSSLLDKMQGTSKLRAAVGVAAPTTVLARVEIVDRYEALSSRIRGQLEQFKTDPTYMELRLEPMDKDGMYVVHDVVDDYPDLTTIAVGDLEERHVIVHRVGFHPEGVDVHQQGAVVRNFTRKKKDSNYGKAVSTNSLQAESIFIAKVNPDGDTRDRRTIEEIQQAMKKRKMGLN